MSSGKEHIVDRIFEIVKICVEKMQDEILLFSVIAILLIIAFPARDILIFAIYLIAIVAYEIIIAIRLSKQQANNRFLDNFNRFLQNQDNWDVRSIGGSDIYFYKDDNNYKIVQSSDSVRDWEPKVESWMQYFPDAHVSEWNVYLKHGESIVSEYVFMSCDGGRYFIPLPKKRCAEPTNDFGCNRFEYVWKRESIEYKISNIMRRFYQYESMEDVANFCRIVIE